MELYSSNPPQTAPNRFMAIIPETCPSEDKRVEKTMPEKSSGQVSTMAVSRRPMGVEPRPPDLATSQPIARAAHNNRYGKRGRLIFSHATAQFPRNAMVRIPAITMPMTCQVFPKVSPISVIPLVSISMNPAPRKKNDKWLNCGASPKKFQPSRRDRVRICKTMTRYDVG